jgi:cobalamin biosynthesis Mg chelatase CobN
MRFLIVNSLLCALSAQNNQQDLANQANELIHQLNNVSPSLISQMTSIAQSVANNQPQVSSIVSSIVASASPHPTHSSHGSKDSSSSTATATKSSASLSTSPQSGTSNASSDLLIMNSFVALTLMSLISYVFF